MWELLWHRPFIFPPTHYRLDRSYHSVQGALPAHIKSFVGEAAGHTCRAVPCWEIIYAKVVDMRLNVEVRPALKFD